jgi:hypothetical protein
MTNEYMTRDDAEQRISNLVEAQNKIMDAVALIEAAVKDTSHEANVRAYTTAHLRNWAEGGNPYDSTLPKIAQWLSEDAGADPASLGWYEDEMGYMG